jgi:hypothetical protein
MLVLKKHNKLWLKYQLDFFKVAWFLKYIPIFILFEQRLPKGIKVVIYQTWSSKSSVLQRPRVYTKCLRLDTSRNFPWNNCDPFHPIPINRNLSRIWNILCSAILQSSLVLFMKVYFAKSQHPHCHLAKFGYFAKLTLPLCQVHFAKFSSPCCHIDMTSFPYRQLHINCYLALWLFCQIANSTSPCAPCGLTELVSSCPPN